MRRRYRDADWLRDRYHGDGRTQAEIADECGVSPRCIREWMARHDIETRAVEGEHHGLYGESRDDETRHKISESMRGREFTDETRAAISEAQRGRSLDEETRTAISEALSGTSKSSETRARISEAMTGARNPNWKGGYYRRYGDGWAVAKERALDRDEVCQRCCEDGTDLELDVHHVVPVRAFHEAEDKTPADAHDLDNLVVLCKRCHALVEHGSVDVPRR
ncbi:NUMOD3 domain-containing DNA-binding protein [Halobacterium yunchengense]|uniref:NUMOD3 domain-containing DNA-binding protein n=1 Tax=Halobacterium yunchengense TaxID=3108497 RepID=UPI0030086D8A